MLALPTVRRNEALTAAVEWLGAYRELQRDARLAPARR